MVYCGRCGTLNSNSAENCANCGAPLYSRESKPFTPYGQQRYGEGYYRRRGGGGLGLLIAGFFIIIIGLAVLLGFTQFWTYFWPIVLILIGIWIVVIGFRRNRRYRQPPPP